MGITMLVERHLTPFGSRVPGPLSTKKDIWHVKSLSVQVPYQAKEYQQLPNTFHACIVEMPKRELPRDLFGPKKINSLAAYAGPRQTNRKQSGFSINTYLDLQRGAN